MEINKLMVGKGKEDYGRSTLSSVRKNSGTARETEERKGVRKGRGE